MRVAAKMQSSPQHSAPAPISLLTGMVALWERTGQFTVREQTNVHSLAQSAQ